MNFTSFRLSKRGMAAQSSVFEGYRTESGVHLEYYIGTDFWGADAFEYAQTRNVIRAFDGDEEVF